MPSPKQRLDILVTLLSEMQHSLLDIQVQHLATVTHGFVGADLAALCNEAALVCLRHYVKFKHSCHDLHSSTLCEGWSSGILERSDCLEDTRNISRDYADSSVSNSGVSSDIQPSFCLKGTIPKILDNIMDGIDEECRLGVTFEDFERARMKVRPSAMREVCWKSKNMIS